MQTVCGLSARPLSLFATAPQDRSEGVGQFLLFHELPLRAPSEMVDHLCDDTAPLEWSEEDVVLLHWRLLQELRHLQDPETPFEEKIDTLNWVFTEPDKESLPFSFIHCLRVVGCSPLSPTAYFGLVDPEDIRERIRANVTRWMRATIARYPQWVRDQIQADPAHVIRQLEKNPQWINEQIKKRSDLGDFFV